MLTNPKLRKGLEEAGADVAAGRVSSLDELILSKVWIVLMGTLFRKVRNR